jgi:hypothetical protein
MYTRGINLHCGKLRTFIPVAVAAVLLMGILGGQFSGAKAEPQEAYMLYHPWFTQDSTAFIQNQDASPTTVQLNFYPSGSNTPYTTQDTVPGRGMLKVSVETVSGIPANVDRLVIQSTGPLKSVVSLHDSSISGDNFALYQGASQGYTEAAFGPFYKGIDGVNSKLILLNTGSGEQTVEFTFSSGDGSITTSFSRIIADNMSLILDASALADIPIGFTGSVRAGSASKFVGLLIHSSQKVYQAQEPLWTSNSTPVNPVSPAHQQFLPRLFYSVDEGAGNRTSQILLLNLEWQQAQVNVNFYDSSTLVSTVPLTVPGLGLELIDLSSTSLTQGEVYSAVVESDTLLAAGEITRSESSTSMPVGSYLIGHDTSIDMPQVASNEQASTIFSIQNLGSGESAVTVDFFDLDGALIHSYSSSIASGTALRMNTSQVSQLGDNFEGHVEASSSQPIKALVDLIFTILPKHQVYLPLTLKHWPPIPTTPILLPVNNADQNNYYTVSWQNTGVGGTYKLEESTDANFSAPTLVYQGSNTAWTVPSPGKFPSTYYYRVKSTNSYGESVWSMTQPVTIYPLFVGLKVRWDGNGYIRGSDYYDIGTHWTNNLDLLTDADTIRSNNMFWYDPNPLGFESDAWYSYYSVTTGQWKASSVPDDPSWKWGYSWKLTYALQLTNGQTVSIDGQPFTVTGPHQGYTSYGKPITYWQFVNQKKFLVWDGGGDWKEYVHPGDIVLRYDAGNSRLLIYDNILRRDYYQGDITSDTVQYIENLTAATSLPGSPPVQVSHNEAKLESGNKPADTFERLELGKAIDH